jgi:hypothetical protein
VKFSSEVLNGFIDKSNEIALEARNRTPIEACAQVAIALHSILRSGNSVSHGKLRAGSGVETGV